MSAALRATPSVLSPATLRILVLASLGGALEFYDFVIFAFLAGPIGAHFFASQQPAWLRQAETFGLFGAGYLARPLGGIIMAHFGDLVGRKAVFTFSVLLMALPTLAIGLLPDYASIGIAAPLLLLLCRVMQGAAIGGEAPGGWVFVAEHAPQGRIGLASGLLTGGLTGGILLGALVILGLHTALPSADVAAFGWRVPFLIGGVFGLASAFLRRWLEETPVFQEMHARAETAAQAPIRLLLKHYKRGILCSVLATWTLTAAIIVLVLMMPALMQSLHHASATETMRASLAATLCLTISVVAMSALSDRIALRTLGAISALLLMLGGWLLYGETASALPLLTRASLAGFCCAFVGLTPIVMLRAFPAAVRFSGLSLSYNIAYAVFGGLTPVLISTLVRHSVAAPAFYVAFAALIGVAATTFAARRS